MKKVIATIGIVLLIVVVVETRSEATDGSCVPPPAGLISWWSGDGNADDRMDNNPGTAENGTTYGEGKVYSAFSFDGIDDNVWIGNPDNLKLSQGEYAVDGWVNFTSLNAPGGYGLCFYPGCDFTIVSKMGFDQYGQANRNGWRLIKQSDNRIWFIVGAPYGAFSGGPNVLQSISPVTEGEWYHVAAVKTQDAIALYVNGVLQESKPLPVDYTDDDTSDVMIGRYIAEPAATMYGLIDEVEIFARALSQTEIQAIYNAGTAGKCVTPQWVDTFDGTVIDLSKWDVSAPLGTSTVAQNDALLLTNDGTGGAFCNTPELRGPGTGIALRKRVSGDFDIQVDFRDFSGPGAAYFNIYQDQSNQMHIKRFPEGIQTFAIAGGGEINGDVSENGTTSGTFRITRSGNTIETFLDGTPNFSIEEAFDGPIIVSLVIGGPGPEFGIASVAFDNFVINSGTLVDPILVCPVEVSIDIKPGSNTNRFNQNGRGVIPVAILGSAHLVVSQVNVNTLWLEGLAVKMVGKSSKYLAHIEDVNGDEYPDLVVQFQDSDNWVASGNGTATLTGQLSNGIPIQGSDSICIVP